MRSDENPFLRKLDKLVELSEAEKAFLRSLQVKPMKVERGREILREGENGNVSYILQSGWSCSYKSLANGERQVIAFPIAGDWVGLRSLFLETSDHTFKAVTDMEVTRVDMPGMQRMLSEFPLLGTVVLLIVAREEALLIEHLASIGRRSAIERTAHYILELFDRLRVVGLSHIENFHCPLTQAHLGDALGLSSVHVNRVLHELRTRNLVTMRNHNVSIHDVGALRELATYHVVASVRLSLRQRTSF